MTSLGALLISLALAAPLAQAKGSKLEQGQKLFNQGDLEGALKLLDQAAQDERDSGQLEKVHLLRGQCFAARQDFVRAEDAFAAALEHNPDSSLDPARVDPTVVKLLDAVRTRLTATLFINSSPPGASLYLDTKNAGVAPQTLVAPIGKHKLEARWGEGPLAPVELVIKPKRELRVEFVQGEAPAPVLVPVQPEEKPIRPFGDVRGVFEMPANQGSIPAGGLEVGGGIELKYFRAGLYARFFPFFGVVPRAALVVPVLKSLSAFIELQLPFWLTRPSGGLGVGIGAVGGAEFSVLPWFGVYAQIGGQFLFVNVMRGDQTAFIASSGVRLRLP